jgi:ferric-dicitrate binding protein FerR (iron transport regulator)
MPYKDSARKRQWEREHREQRNAQRRMRRLEPKNGLSSRNSSPDPTLAQKPNRGWKGVVGLAVGLGFVLLAALGGINLPSPGSRGHVA